MADFTPIGVGTSANDGTGDTLRVAAQLINANWVQTPKLDHAKAYTAPQSFYPGTASAPGIYFVGDSNTGIFWYAADTLSFTAGGINRLDITTTAINSALPYRSSATGSAGVPIFSFFGDTDTGIWSSGADILSFATGGVNRLDITTTAINSALPYRSSAGGNAATPDYSFFGDTDTGIYRIGADSIGIATGGTLRKTIDTAAETNTLPTLGPAGSASAPAFSFSGDSNTGIYNIGADSLGLATGGTLRKTVDTTAETNTLVTRGPAGSASAPAFSFSGDTDTGVYNVGADQLGIATGGTLRRTIGTSAETVTLPQQGADGSASAPQYTFSADTDNGLYRAGTNNPAIAAGGSQVMSFLTTGITQPLQPCFVARVSATLADKTGDATAYSIVFDTEVVDRGANHNAATGVFTAPVTGIYAFFASILLTGLTSSHTTGWLELYVNTTIHFHAGRNVYATQRSDGYLGLSLFEIVPLTAGDTVACRVSVTGGTKVVDVYGDSGFNSWWGGALLF